MRVKFNTVPRTSQIGLRLFVRTYGIPATNDLNTWVFRITIKREE